jgi:hypothetical protein
MAAILALASLAVAGCGSDSSTVDSTTPRPPAGTPTSTATTPTTKASTAPSPYSTTPQQPDEGHGRSGGGSSGGGSSGGGGSGGTPAPSGGGNGSGGTKAPDDSPSNDQPPPPGSPAQRYEQYCNANPGACD